MHIPSSINPWYISVTLGPEQIIFPYRFPMNPVRRKNADPYLTGSLHRLVLEPENVSGAAYSMRRALVSIPDCRSVLACVYQLPTPLTRHARPSRLLLSDLFSLSTTESQPMPRPNR